MLESLKDLYISYPFLPVPEKPAWFNHIKDIRLSVVLEAANAISEYKNANNVRAWLTAIDPVEGIATFKVQCLQFGITDKEVTADLMCWEDGTPSVGSYVIVDNDLTYWDEDAGMVKPLPALTGVAYELNPDVLLFMQKAPVMYYDEQMLPHTVAVCRGYNVTASKITNGIELYGAPGAGLGRYENPPMPTDDKKKNLGASSINGAQGMVWLTATFPTKLTIDPSTTKTDKIILTIDRETLE